MKPANCIHNRDDIPGGGLQVQYFILRQSGITLPFDVSIYLRKVMNAHHGEDFSITVIGNSNIFDHMEVGVLFYEFLNILYIISLYDIDNLKGSEAYG
jgi:hypothetical protein